MGSVYRYIYLPTWSKGVCVCWFFLSFLDEKSYIKVLLPLCDAIEVHKIP